MFVDEANARHDDAQEQRIPSTSNSRFPNDRSAITGGSFLRHSHVIRFCLRLSQAADGTASRQVEACAVAYEYDAGREAV